MLELTVFICGAVLMIFELVGSRVLAPYLGTSVIIWTNLIGIILGSLSIGYYLGGKYADKNPSYHVFSAVIFLSGLLIAAATAFYDIFLTLLTESGLENAYLESLIATLVLFSPASVCLGMVSPYAVKLKLKSIAVSGATVGRLYAISTVGSIVGTFFGGIFLISFIGTKNILFLLSATLVATSLIFIRKKDLRKKRTLVLFWLLASIWGTIFYTHNFSKNVLKDVDTAYNRIVIYTAYNSIHNKPIRVMQINNELSSAMFLNDDELVFPYTRYYRLAAHFKPDLKKTLLIGGAAYSYPKDFLKQFPESTIDVVEIDPEVTALAREYFGLKDDKRLRIFHQDGRIFLNRTQEKYDVIFGDAFKSKVPPHTLTTKEAVIAMHKSLHDDGIALVNLIGSFEGEKGRIIEAEYNTFSSIFPQVYVFKIEDDLQPTDLQNIMLVALKGKKTPEFSSSNTELNGYLSRRWTKNLSSKRPVLTDDFSPVEYYTMNSF